MTDLSSQLAELAAAVEILSPESFRLAERVVRVGDPAPVFPVSTAGPGPEPPRDALTRSLTDHLYSSWYARCDAAAAPPADLEAHRAHLVRLLAANTSSGTWEPDWVFDRAADDGGVDVAAWGLVFRARLEDVRPHPSRLSPGDTCRVRVPSVMRSLVPGFLCVSGEADRAGAAERSRRLRLYWHLTPGAAPPWIEGLTRRLDRCGVPFRLKLLSDPRFYLRADAGVVLLEPGDWERARPAIERTYGEVGDHLRPTVPALTRRLAAGLGFAEGAADGSSHGVAACRRIADALVAASAAGAAGTGASDAERAAVIAAAYRADGLDPARPHRAAGSTTRFQPPSLPAAGAKPAPPATPAPAPDPLAAAAAIGDALCRRAFRRDGRCNWMGRVYAPGPDGRDLAPALGALGPELYGGTAGIALFLAELADRGHDPEHRATALGAAEQALDALRREPERWRPIGFYEGRLGVGWAARRVARLTGAARLEAEAEALLATLAGRLPGERATDLLGGNAGAILLFLRLHEEIPTAPSGAGVFLEAARRLGRELLPEVRLVGAAVERPPALTGLSHGASGLGLALLELAIATEETDLRRAADHCFAYEDGCFDAEHGNWPDFRRPSTSAGGPPWGFMTAWCHGAPGIAMARLRAMVVDPSRAERYEPVARAGLATTARAIESALATRDPDLGLCHGLAGLADVADLGGRELALPELTSLAARAMARVAARAAAEAENGLASGRLDDPSLLTGDAGVGHALLRFLPSDRAATLLLPAARRDGLSPPAAEARSGATSRPSAPTTMGDP